MDERWPFFTTDLELTNVCGQNCIFCPRDKMSRPEGFISRELFAALVPQLAEIDSRVTLCGMGNPLLHPSLPEIADICQANNLKYGLTIQAPALSPDNINRIKMLAPAFIEISFATLDKELFAQIYPGQRLEDSLHGVEALACARKSTRGMVVVAVRTEREKLSQQEIENFWAEKKITCRQPLCHSRGGHLSEKGLVLAKPSQIVRCGLFATHSFITWQGKLLACCHDLAGDTEIADLNLVRVKEAAQRKIEIMQNQMPYNLCLKCDEPTAHRPVPERPFPESEKARSRYLKHSCQKPQA